MKSFTHEAGSQRCWMLIAGVYSAPFISLVLINFEQVWYGQGWGKIGAASAVLILFLSFAGSVYGCLRCRGATRFFAALAVSVYLYLTAIQML